MTLYGVHTKFREDSILERGDSNSETRPPRPGKHQRGWGVTSVLAQSCEGRQTAEGRLQAGERRQCQADAGMGRGEHARETLRPYKCTFAFSLPFFFSFLFLTEDHCTYLQPNKKGQWKEESRRWRRRGLEVM